MPPQKTVEEHAREQATFVQEKLGPRLEQARRGRRQVYFVDAAHFVFAPFLGCLWCAARLFVRAASGRKRYNVLGALDAVTHRLVRVTNHDYINAESVGAVDAVAAASVGLPITLVLDNSRYQKCAVVQALASSLGIELLYLPGYSPNLNLIERLWRFVRSSRWTPSTTKISRIHGCDRSVPGRSAHSPQGRDGNSNDSQVPDVWRCATIGRVEYNRSVAAHRCDLKRALATSISLPKCRGEFHKMAHGAENLRR